MTPCSWHSARETFSNPTSSFFSNQWARKHHPRVALNFIWLDWWPLIHSIVLKMDGVAGPSDIDATGWKSLCVSFHAHSVDLCNAITSLAKQTCTAYVDPRGLKTIVVYILIALYKCPGVEPIRIGETTWHSSCYQNRYPGYITGPVQLCAGHEGGCEFGLHTMKQVFNSSHFDAVIQVDVSNAFNSLNHQTALRNNFHLYPSLSKLLIDIISIRC